MQNIGALMKKYGIRPKHGLGQNFLVDDSALDKIVDAAELEKTDNVLEVGAGLGVLTKELVQHAKKVLAVEIDSALAYVLKQEMRPLLVALREPQGDNAGVEFKVIEADILKLPLREIETFFKNESYKIVANIPYKITSHFLRRFLELERPPQSMTLLVQKEVAERIVAKPGEMSLLSLSAQFYSEPKIIGIVKAGSFLPAPKVDSAIINLGNIKQLSDAEKLSVANLFRLARIGFSAKRKQLQNNFAAGLGITKDEARNMIERAGLNPLARAQDLRVEDWERLIIE